jgi:hypothetical protein
MANIIHADAASKIDVFLSLHVGDERPFRLYRKDRMGIESPLRDMGISLFEE